MSNMDIDIAQLAEWYLQSDLTRYILLFLGFVMLLAFVSSIVTKKLNLPVVIGYVLLGALFSTSVLGNLKFVSKQFIDYYNFLIRSFDYIAYVALGFVAFMIGLDLSIRLFRTLGKSIIMMTFFEAFGAFFLVMIVMNLVGLPFYQALMLGAVAAATAPAATVMVIKSLNARGPLTSTILAIVGFDDAIALIIYSFAAPIAHSFLEESVHFSVFNAVVVPCFKIIVSVVIGSIIGYVAIRLLNKMRAKQDKVVIIFTTIFVTTAITDYFGLSHLIGNMAAGFVVRNMARHYLGLSDIFDIVMVPLFAVFFILAGFKLKITLITNVHFILLGFLYMVSRLGGKVFGASSGAALSKAPPVVRKYVGFGLLSQVGVAIALAYIIEHEFIAVPSFGNFVFNLLLFTTLFTEIIGPIALRRALIKSGEANIK